MPSFLATFVSTNSSRQEHLVLIPAELTDSTASPKVTGVLDNQKSRNHGGKYNLITGGKTYNLNI